MYAITILDLFINYHIASKKARTFFNKQIENFSCNITAVLVLVMLLYPRNKSVKLGY